VTRAACLVVIALIAAPVAAQVGRTKERPNQPPTKSAPKPATPALPPAPREPWTSAANFGLVGGAAFAIAWNPNGPILAVGDAKTISFQFRDALSGEAKATISIPGRGAIQATSFSPDGATLAVGGFRGADALLWLVTDEHGKRVELNGHSERVTAVAWNRDGNRVASASWDGSVRVWDAATGEKLLLLAAHGSLVTSVAYAGNQYIATGCEDSVVRIWDARTGDLFAALRGHAGTVQGVAFAGDGRTLVSCGNDGTVRLWDVRKKAQRASVKVGKAILFALALDPDGKRIAAGGDDGTVRVWNLEGQEVSLVTIGKAVRSIAWAPDGQSIAVGDIDGGIHIWTRKSTAQVRDAS
jgi:WD40 repeat protein